MNATIIRTQVQKRTPLHFLVDGLQVWATYLDTKDNEPFGVRFIWMEGKYSSSPLEHITRDEGQSYHQFESFLMLDGTMDMRLTIQETDSERLKRLQRIWVAYQQETQKAKTPAPEGLLCAHCHDASRPLTEENSVNFSDWFARDSEGKQITVANVHRECADAWIDAHGGQKAIARDDRKV